MLLKKAQTCHINLSNKQLNHLLLSMARLLAIGLEWSPHTSCYKEEKRCQGIDGIKIMQTGKGAAHWSDKCGHATCCQNQHTHTDTHTYIHTDCIEVELALQLHNLSAYIFGYPLAAAVSPSCHIAVLPLATCFYATNHWHNLKPRSSAQCSVLSTLVARALRCLLYYFCCCSFQCGGIVGLSVHSMHATLSDCQTVRQPD